ncbi:MAG: hypothetical protein EBR30_11540 [Cytophagia bacterium]|nr:hypothetical protein [Cytophagia bacterium]
MLPIYACNSQHAGQVEYKLYKDEGTGWVTKFQNSFQVMSAEEIAKLEGRGQVAMEETLDEKLVLTHKNLLWLKKDQFNSFTSNSQPFDAVTDGSYAENQALLFETIEETFKNQGLEFNVKYGKVLIDNLEFSTMETTLYTPDRKKVIMNQIMYDRLINGTLSLTLNINYNNEVDKAVLLDIINSSKFSKRK